MGVAYQRMLICSQLEQRIHPHYLSLLLLSSILLAFACSSRPHPASSPEVPEDEVIVMPGLLIKPGQEVLSPTQLFDEGIGAFQGQKFKRCEERLHTYVRHFPTGEHIHPTHYNLGLCLEMQRKHAQAAEHFRAFANNSTEISDRLDGEVRLGYNLIFSAQFKQADELYSHILTSYEISGFDRAECHLRRAMARIALKFFAEADHDLNSALGHINGAIGPYRQGNEALAELHFQRGELYRQYMAEVQLTFPLEDIKQSVTDKVRFFRRSLYAFVESIKVNHTYWAIAAGHQLGVLHEDIYEDLLNADYPPDFDEEMKAYYFYELDKKLAPIIRESISIYERTITISAKQGAENEWVRSTEASLLRLRHLEEQLQRRLAQDPLEAYQLRKREPFIREPITVPLPPSPSQGSHHEQSLPISNR